jgi:hypothetical protein
MKRRPPMIGIHVWRHALSLALVGTLMACTGSDSTLSEFEHLEAEASTQAANTRMLAVGSPCAEASQCGKLYLMPTRGVCAFPTPLAYSTVSATAKQAEAAAAAQNATAAKAFPLQPGGIPPNVSCVAGFPDAPLVCERGSCVMGPAAWP